MQRVAADDVVVVGRPPHLEKVQRAGEVERHVRRQRKAEREVDDHRLVEVEHDVMRIGGARRAGSGDDLGAVAVDHHGVTRVGGGRADHDMVVAVSGVDQVIAVAPVDEIVAVAPEQPVVAGVGAQNRVVAVRAVDVFDRNQRVARAERVGRRACPQIDRYAPCAGFQKVGDLIVARPAVQRVGPGPAHQRLGPAEALQQVVAVASEQQVIAAGGPAQRVGEVRAVHLLDPDQRVGRAETVERGARLEVDAHAEGAGFEEIRDLIDARAAIQRVGPFAPDQGIATAEPVEAVCPFVPEQHVAHRLGPDQRVGDRGAVHLFDADQPVDGAERVDGGARLEVDLHAEGAGFQEIGDLVDADAAVQGVGALAAHQRVGAARACEAVGAVAAEEEVAGCRSPGEGIGKVRAVDLFDAGQRVDGAERVDGGARLEVDLHAEGAGFQEIGDLVGSRAAVQGVGALAAHQRVGAARAREAVCPAKARQQVAGGLGPAKGVAEGRAVHLLDRDQHIDRSAGVGGTARLQVNRDALRSDLAVIEHPVGAGAAVQRIGPGPAHQRVIARPAQQGVGPGMGYQRVVAGLPIQKIVARAAQKLVRKAVTRNGRHRFVTLCNLVARADYPPLVQQNLNCCGLRTFLRPCDGNLLTFPAFCRKKVQAASLPRGAF